MSEINQLAWTSTTPMREGWYWFKWDDDGEVEVMKVKRLMPNEELEASNDNGCSYGSLGIFTGLWAGPLQPPA